MRVIVESADPADAELCVRAVLLMCALAGHAVPVDAELLVRPIVEQGALW